MSLFFSQTFLSHDIISLEYSLFCYSDVLISKKMGAKYCSMVEHPFMMQWVVRLIPPGGPIKLFLAFLPGLHNWFKKEGRKEIFI